MTNPSTATPVSVPTDTASEPFGPVEERVAVEAAQRGDQEALGQIYTHYFPRVFRYVNARLRQVEDAEDVTEEVFFRIVDKLGGYTFRGLPFSAWVFRIARNEVVSHVRRQKVRIAGVELPEQLPDESQDHVTAIEFQSTVQAVRDATERLPEAQRQVIALRFGSGLSVAETAKALSKTENNVKVLQHKAIARLQGQFAGWEER